MGHSGGEISCGIDRVAGASAQGQADRPDESSKQQRAESWRQTARRDAARKQCGGDEDENKCSKRFAEKVPPGPAYRRGRAEAGEFRTCVVRHGPMRLV